MQKITLVLIAFSLFLVSGNALLCGLFGCNNPTFLIVDPDLNISDLLDVNVNSPLNNQILVFNSTALQWENQNQAGAAGTRTYTGIPPITVDNDNNLLGWNPNNSTDFNGTFDDLNSDEFGRLNFDNNFTLDNNFSRLQVDNFFGDISGASGYTLDQAYDAYATNDANITVDDLDLLFNIRGGNRIIFNTQTPMGFGVSGSEIQFRLIGSPVTSDIGAFWITDQEDETIMLISTARAALALPVVQSAQWEPITDNKFDLGAADRRWANLFLAGVIKGQSVAPASTVAFELDGGTGDFDTIGDINALNATFQGDVNANDWGGDANFNRLEADFFFGDGSGLTNLPNGVTGVFEGGNIDVNANEGDVLVSFDDGNFLDSNHLWIGDQNFLRINVADLNAQDATFTTKGLVNINPRYLDVNNGELNFDTNTQDLLHFFDGTILETIDVDVNSDGTDVNLFIGREDGGNVILVFNNEYFSFDTTPVKTIALTAGTDTNPTLNYVFIPNSTQVLTANTTDFPTDAEFAPVATVLVQSAVSVVVDGVYKLHVWTDHSDDEDTHQGHQSHINSWIRMQSATWMEGVVQTLTITTNAGVPDNVDFAVTSGTVLQLHSHPYPAFDTASDSNIFVVNDSGAAFTKVDDLNALLTDSTGGDMTGRYFTLVSFGVVSEDSGDSKLMFNLPSGSYNKESDAIDDVSDFANFNIPVDFRGTGFLISKLVLRHQPASGGTWTSIQETDLRGLFPSTAAAGGSGAVTTSFPDNLFLLFNVTDSTKELQFDLSGISASTRRLWTVQDANGTVPLLEFFNAWDSNQLFSNQEGICFDQADCDIRIYSPSFNDVRLTAPAAIQLAVFDVTRLEVFATNVIFGAGAISPTWTLDFDVNHTDGSIKYDGDNNTFTFDQNTVIDGNHSADHYFGDGSGLTNVGDVNGTDIAPNFVTTIDLNVEQDTNLDGNVLIQGDLTLTNFIIGPLAGSNRGINIIFDEGTANTSIRLQNDVGGSVVFSMLAGVTDHVSAVAGSNQGWYFFENAGSGENKELRLYGFPTGSSNDYASFQIINSTDDLKIRTNKTGSSIFLAPFLTGDVRIGTEFPGAKLSVAQGSMTGARPVLELLQSDVDESFVDFEGTTAADGSRSISSDTTEDSAKFGAIRIEINGVAKWIRIYDDES